MTIIPAQCRAARALLDWPQPKLAKAAGLTRTTIVQFERSTRKPYPNTVKAIQAAFEAAGITFIDPTRTTGCGVKFRDPPGA